MPKRTANQKSGDQAEAFVAKAITDMGFIWHPRHTDFGIDGEIEIVDRAGEVSGFVASVQVKGTRDRFVGETERTFSYTLKADHMAYWQRATTPVLLICVSIVRQQAWWRRLDDVFADPKSRAKRVVTFDKVADSFDSGAIGRVAAAVTPARAPLPALPGSETLTTNLLEIVSFAPLIYSAATSCRERSDAWALMSEAGNYESGFVLSGGRLFSFSPLVDGSLSVLVSGSVESESTGAWSRSQDPDIVRRFVALLNFTLRSIHHNELEWHRKKGVVFYRANPDLTPTTVKGKSTRSRGKTFFSVYHGKDDINKVRYCRHYAADLRFRCWDKRWYLEITPTYHYTIDGKRDSFYEAEYLAGIKRLERNRAVLDLTRAWADFVASRQEATLFTPGDQRIVFGSLETLSIDAVIDEKAWTISAPEFSDDAFTLELGA